jgi:hypothetical protein
MFAFLFALIASSCIRRRLFFVVYFFGMRSPAVILEFAVGLKGLIAYAANFFVIMNLCHFRLLLCQVSFVSLGFCRVLGWSATLQASAGTPFIYSLFSA